MPQSDTVASGAKRSPKQGQAITVAGPCWIFTSFPESPPGTHFLQGRSYHNLRRRKTSKRLNHFGEMIVVEDMNIKNGIILTTLATLTAFGQATVPSSRTAAPDSPKARLEFEVASIRPSPPATQGQVQVGLHVDGAMIRINYLNLKDYIAMAYQMKLYQVIGPEWLASDAERFDISAKLPEKSNRSQVDQMLRSLLQDRFQLKTHTESKEFPVYALVLGKSALQLKESPPDNVDADARSEERRVGKECRSRWSPYPSK